LNCYLTFAFPLWQRVWSIISRPLLLLSGLFYIYEDLPQMAQTYFWFNPLLHVTGHARTGYFSTYAPEYISMTYVAVFGAVPLLFGVILLYGYGKSMMHK